MKARIGLNGFIYFLSLCVVLIFHSYFLKVAEGRLDEVFEIFGMAFLLLGLLLRISSRGYKSEVSKGGNALVTGGPYALVRNPMYLGIFCSGFGVILLLFQWWAAGVFVVFMTVRYMTLIRKEEEVLCGKFGEAYREYMKRVPSLLPRAGVLLRTDIKDIFPLRMRWVKKEVVSVMVVLLAVVGIEYWESRRLNVTHLIRDDLLSLIVVGAVFAGVSFGLAYYYEKHTTHV
jgi:protein-S-isoprenylcysteine O-methyltransferase Ste14